MRILVTGGAGFIGAALARRLLADGHTVMVADDLSTGSRENVPSGADFLERDLSDPSSMEALPEDGVDAVCHLAAQSSGQISEENPHRDFAINAGATLLLARWCLARGVRRFLYASSMAVYGEGTGEFLTEGALCAPKSHYGVSKLASEHFLKLAAGQGLESTSFRMFSVYGPGQNLANLKQGMVSIYLAYMLRGVPIPVTGSLERVRDFVYVDDVVDVWMRALLRPRTESPVYNIGTGRRVTVRELLAALCSALDVPQSYPVVEHAGSPADQYAVVADTSRACAELEWRPRVDLTTGLRRMTDWARSQAAVQGRR